jgi:SAM-dependent methyltransferase
MKINIGAGEDKILEFASCDNDPLSNPDYLFDLERDTFPFEDNSVDAVVAHHVLEHLGDGYFHCLKELYRVCKHGTIIDVRVPHPRHYHFINDPTHKRPITPDGLKLFSRKYNDFWKDSRASRLGYVYGVDFEVFDVQEIPDPAYRDAFEGKQADMVQRYIHEHNNIVAEYYIKLVVIKHYD